MYLSFISIESYFMSYKRLSPYSFLPFPVQIIMHRFYFLFKLHSRPTQFLENMCTKRFFSVKYIDMSLRTERSTVDKQRY